MAEAMEFIDEYFKHEGMRGSPQHQARVMEVRQRCLLHRQYPIFFSRDSVSTSTFTCIWTNVRWRRASSTRGSMSILVKSWSLAWEKLFERQRHVWGERIGSRFRSSTVATYTINGKYSTPAAITSDMVSVWIATWRQNPWLQDNMEFIHLPVSLMSFH